jgi:hypothetical protein
MSIRVAFDLDGVLADMDGELGRCAQKLFGIADPVSTGVRNSVDPRVPPTRLKLSAHQLRRLWQHVQAVENFWGTLREIEPGMVARLGTVAAQRRWEVIFLTKRPESAGDTAQIQTQRWLESMGFPLPSVFVVQGSRGRIASALALDVVVDDRLDNCLDVIADSKARAVLVWREGAGRLPPSAKRMGVRAVRSVAECLDVLAGAEGIVKERGSVVSRVMRALGRKHTASA